MLRDAALRVDHVQLAMVAPGIRRQQRGGDGVGRFAGAQPRHAGRRIHRVDQRLGGQRRDAALDMDRQRADGEEARRHRRAQRAGGRITHQNGPGHVPHPRRSDDSPQAARLRRMQPRAPIATDLVLLGAGHAHVEVLRRFAMRPEPGVRLTLIGREPETPYTGMLPGLIRGDYTFDEAHIDLAPLAASAGARLILAEATAIDLADRRVAVVGRPDVPFDLLSIDVGGEPVMPPGGGAAGKADRAVPGAPVGAGGDPAPGARIAVVGGGAGGTELALALALRYRERVRIVLVCDTPEPLATAPPYARRVARAALVDAGVELACGVRAGAWADGRLALSDGSFLEVGTALWATGVVGPAFLAASGLACDASGCARVMRRCAASVMALSSPPATVPRSGDPRPKPFRSFLRSCT